MKTSEIFEREIGFIKNETLRKIVADTLDAAPECIQTIPASSSGKYHPKADLGEGGLVRHIKTVTAVCRSLMDSDNFADIVLSDLTKDSIHYHYNTIVDSFVKDTILDAYKDIALAACILHDVCKPDDTPEHKTVFDHPIKAAELFKSIAEKHFTDNNQLYLENVIPITYNVIASHMGRWNTASYTNVVLPTPRTGIEVIVHLCDYLASRKFFDFNFDVYEECDW